MSDLTLADLGAPVGRSAGSEVYPWEGGRVVKLFNAGALPALVRYEARVTRLVHESGAPAPRVDGLIEVDGRLGIILPRFDGPTLGDRLRNGEIAASDCGATLAATHFALHKGRHSAPIRSFAVWVSGALAELAGRGIPPDVTAIASRNIGRLPADGIVCHGDLHVDNVLITSSGPVIVDWVSAFLADPLVDVARQHLTLTLLDGGYPEVRRAIDEAFIAGYADLSGTSVKGLIENIAPYLAVLAVTRMLDSTSTASERERLIALFRGIA